MNLKYRLTGAVILIGVAVGVTSLLIGRQDNRDVEQSTRETGQETFVSRIVNPENPAGDVPAPTAPPVEDGGSETGTKSPAAGEARMQVEPVLEFDRRLSKPIPRLNTVEAGATRGESIEIQPPEPESQVTAPSDESWIVRVGAFSEAANAERILRRLKEGGYEAFSAPIDVGGKRMMRVWIGPYPDRKSATRAKSEISRDFDLNGFIVRDR